MPRRKKDIVRPGYQNKGKDSEPEQPKKRKATWDGFQDRTPAEIAEECRKIQETWSEAERRSRIADPKMREEPVSWSIPIICTDTLEMDVEGLLPMSSAPWEILDEVAPDVVQAERPKNPEDLRPHVLSIIRNKGRRKAG